MGILEILLSAILALGLYPAAGEVVGTDVVDDLVYVETTDGNTWDFEADGVEDWEIGDKCALIFFDNGTEEIEDDMIVTARYIGFSERGEDFYDNTADSRYTA